MASRSYSRGSRRLGRHVRNLLPDEEQSNDRETVRLGWPFNKLPWDINFTNGGFALIVILLILEAELVLMSFDLFATGPIKYPIFLVPLLLALVLIKILGPWGYRWAHFVGTDVNFKSMDGRHKAVTWAQDNLPQRHWDIRLMDSNSRFHTIRFRNRRDAMLAKLSV